MIERVLAEKGIRQRVGATTLVAAPPVVPSFTPPPLPRKPDPVAFVCEADVRAAIAAGKKIPIGPKTLITPSAQDLGRERGAFEMV